MWTYKQRTGELFNSDPEPVAVGYSGNSDGKNNPAMQNVPCEGPIPQGDYTISGPPVDTASHGPFVLHLVPSPANEMFGRAGFLIHGDSIVSPGTASEGCIIMPRPVRERIWNSGDRDLKVVAD